MLKRVMLFALASGCNPPCHEWAVLLSPGGHVSASCNTSTTTMEVQETSSGVLVKCVCPVVEREGGEGRAD